MGILDALSSARPMEASRFEAPVEVLKGLNLRRNVVGATLPSGSQPAGDGGAGGSGPSAAGGQPPALTDLTLPAEVMRVVADALSDYDMTLTIRKMEQKWGDPCTLHVAVNGGFSISLMHFSAELLEDPKWIGQIGVLGWLFAPGERVRVLSKDCQKLHPSFQLMWSAWTEGGIETEYAEWRDVASLETLKGLQRATMLSRALRFPGSVKPVKTPRRPVDLLQDAVRFAALATILSDSGSTSRSPSVSEWINNLLLAASVPKAIRDERAEWGSNYPDAARSMIEWLLGKGTDPGKKGYGYLASVLEPWTEKIGADRKAQVLEILVRFQLMPKTPPGAE